MSILIKGMEMPTSCESCMFSRRSIHNIDWCVLTEKDLPSDCPLVPVPPHGDLIDRKTAYDSLLNGMVMTGYQSRALDCINEIYAPTIIEAEEGE